MLTFIVRRLFYAILVIWGVMSITFFITMILPGDPVRLMMGQRSDLASEESLRELLGLDKPRHIQYLHFIANAAQGDLGKSYATNRDVLEAIMERVPATVLLATSAMLLATIFGIAIGVLSAVKANTWVDTASMSFALLGISLPSFVVGSIFLLIFTGILKWTSAAGYINRGWDHLILPMITLGIRPLSIIARLTRASMLEVFNQDYVRTARSKGLSDALVTFKHVLRNALNPVLTTVSAWFAAVLAGTFFIEFIFSWPGIGLLTINAIQKLDYPLIRGTVLFTAIVFVIINVVVDILYAYLDPRVKLS